MAALSILQTVHAMNNNGLSVPFGATGGTAPYTWSVEAGGAGGTIDAATGVYTSPDNATGEDVITVTDSAAATASFTMLIDTPILLVCDILQTCLGLSAGQVILYNSKFDLPNDSALYIAVGVVSSKPFSNLPKYDGNTCTQTINMNTSLSIDIMSRSTKALMQKEQVLMALSSPYAQSQMELNSFYVSCLSSNFINLSAIDAMAIPYRFNITVQLQYFTQLVSDVPFYDTFDAPAITVEP